MKIYIYEDHYQLSFSDGVAKLHLVRGGEAHGSSPFTSTPRGIVIEGDLLLFDDDKVSVCLIWCLDLTVYFHPFDFRDAYFFSLAGIALI